MNFKFNALENIIYIIVMFIGLGTYHKLVVEDILIIAIQTETNKIETNIKTDIDNKFKKIESLTSSLGVSNPSDNNMDASKNDCYISKDEFSKYSASLKRRIAKEKK